MLNFVKNLIAPVVDYQIETNNNRIISGKRYYKGKEYGISKEYDDKTQDVKEEKISNEI